MDKILKQMGDMRLINTRIYTSKDDRYIIQETCIKTIKPTAYYQAIIDNMGKEKPYAKRMVVRKSHVRCFGDKYQMKSQKFKPRRNLAYLASI